MTYPSAETILQTRVAAEKKAKTQAENRLELVQRVQECVLGLVRTNMTDVADNAFLADCSSGTINFCSVGIVMVTERPFVIVLID